MLPSVSESVKRLKCNDCLEILTNTYRSHESEIEPSAMRSLAGCLGEIFLSQEENNELWESGVVKKAFSLLLTLCMNDSAKVRHSAQDVVSAILEKHSRNGFVLTSRQVIRQLDILCKEFNEDAYQDVLNYLILIAKVILFISQDFYPTLFQLLLKVRSLSLPDPQLRQHQCQMVDYRALFPLEVLLNSDRYVAPELLQSIFPQLQAVATPAVGTDKDTTEYAAVLLLLCRAQLRIDLADALPAFLTVLRTVVGFFITPNAALHKSLSMFLIGFFPTLTGMVPASSSFHASPFLKMPSSRSLRSSWRRCSSASSTPGPSFSLRSPLRFGSSDRWRRRRSLRCCSSWWPFTTRP